MLVLQSAAVPPASDARSATAGPLRPRLEIVEQGVEDRGGLVTSTRVLPVDMRLPAGFSVVYRSPGDDGSLMRGNGALFAVFPRSQYRRVAGGSVPLVPAGVVYSIGMPGRMNYPGGALVDHSSTDEPGRAERSQSRVDLRMRPKPVAPETQASAPVSIQASASVVDPMSPISEAPPISEAARATAPRSPQPRPAPVIDLRLGPPVLVRE